MKFKNKLIKIALAITATVGINYMATVAYTRIDLTQDQRYTLSEASINTVKEATESIYIDVFLEGSLPSEFKRLQLETKQLLEAFSIENKNIIVTYIDPKTLNEDLNIVTQEMQNYGMSPARVDVLDGGKTTQEIVFPWAVINHNKKTVNVPLLKNNMGNTSQERINNSVQHLEYAFASGFKNVTNTTIKNIAHLVGKEVIDGKYLYDFYSTLEKEYNYKITPIDIDSVNTKPLEVLKNINNFDLIIIAKPKERFTDKEKYALDQYTINGGNSLWMLDAVHAERDSIKAPDFKTLAFGLDLNLDDLFFNYGFRINPVIVKDMYAADIVLTDGNGQLNKYPWFYNPLVLPQTKHEIVNNINGVKFEFANQIEIVKQGIQLKKTPLLQSSPLSATKGAPSIISFNEIDISKKPDLKRFNKQYLNLAVLIEGDFTSNYKNRVKPIPYNQHKDEKSPGKIIVISDGDIIKNQLEKGKPLPLGFDKWTGRTYGNKEFLLNCVNYLLDDTGIMKVRNKEVKIPLLDVEKIAKEEEKWQLINIGLPLLFLTIFGLGYTFYRKKKYA